MQVWDEGEDASDTIDRGNLERIQKRIRQKVSSQRFRVHAATLTQHPDRILQYLPKSAEKHYGNTIRTAVTAAERPEMNDVIVREIVLFDLNVKKQKF